MNLFRSEAVEARRGGLHGAVTIHQPVTFKVLTGIVVIITSGALILLSTASFAKKETAQGWLVPEFGMAEVYAPAGSTLKTIVVHPGARVIKGQLLGTITNETYSLDGPLSEEQNRQTRKEIGEVDAQTILARSRVNLAVQKARQEESGIRSEVAVLGNQLNTQKLQLILAERQFDDAEPLVAKGFISRFDQDRREQGVLTAKANISSIAAQIQSQSAQMTSFSSDADQARLQGTLEISQLKSARDSLETNLINNTSKSLMALRSPVDGIVAATNLRPGETVKSGLPIVSLAPPGQIDAELLLPTHAAGFIRAGQSVRLFIDAYPYQRYGALTGVVSQVSSAAVKPGDYIAPIKFEEPSYRINVKIMHLASDRTGPMRLKPGMTLSGNIVTERRSIIQWLFDPLLSAKEAWS